MNKENGNFNFKNLLTAVIGVVAIILITYILVGTDPKGLLFGLSLTAYGVAATISSAILILSKNRKYSLDYYFIMTANGVNIYLSSQFIFSLLQNEISLSAWSIINLINITGALLGLQMLNKLLGHNIKKSTGSENE